MDGSHERGAGEAWLTMPSLSESYRYRGDSGDVYEQAVVKTAAGFFRGSPTHLFGITRFGALGVYVRAGSSHLNEVVRPQSPRAESSQVIPQIVA
jgi:hypothetical protein